MTIANIIAEARLRSKGLLLVVLVALAAKFLSEHYGAPAMLFALLIGMALNWTVRKAPRGLRAGLVE